VPREAQAEAFGLEEMLTLSVDVPSAGRAHGFADEALVVWVPSVAASPRSSFPFPSRWTGIKTLRTM